MPLRPAAPRHQAFAALVAFVLMLPATAGADSPVVTEVAGATFHDINTALVDAIADEGIGAPSVSHFGSMLARTAADLGHRPDFYADAQIHTFCSAAIAARLAAESAHNIALCPLSIAVYRVLEKPHTIYLSYRRSAPSPGGEAANALLQRIVQRAAEQFGTPSPRPR
ncbi:MAG: DUF302 domain-containing protein [Azoarcus sp.]|nr:DUF302 domain-containing protein [Azoarcus sp.]